MFHLPFGDMVIGTAKKLTELLEMLVFKDALEHSNAFILYYLVTHFAS